MFARLGMFPLIAGAVVVVVAGGWSVVTQTSLLGQNEPVPVVAASDEQTAIKVEDDATQPEETGETGADEAEAVEETVEETVEEAEEISTNAEEVVEEEMVVSAPTFDLVRVEGDGTTVVAGTGPAGWDITVLVDDEDMTTVPADATGQFVAFLDLGTSDLARVMTLRASDGQTFQLSEAQVIIAPVATQVAEADETDMAEEAVDVAETEETMTEDAAETDTASTDEAVSEETAEETASVTTVEEDVIEATDTAESAVEEATETVEAAVEEIAEAVTEETTPTVSSSDSDGVQPVETVADTAETAEASEDEVTEEVAEADVAENGDTTEVAQVAETEATEETTDVSTGTTEATEEAATPTAPAVLLVGDDGVQVMQAATPEVLAELSIAAITYSEDGSVFLTGFSPAGFLRVYVNNQQVVVLEVPEPGEWKAELIDVAPGVYTLRVDQIDENGDVVQRVETPFKREEPAKVVEAVQTQARKPLTSQSVVQPGSTLWAISREAYGSGILYVRIFEANKGQIRNPHLIYPGQIFELPAPPGAQKQKRSSGQ